MPGFSSACRGRARAANKPRVGARQRGILMTIAIRRVGARSVFFTGGKVRQEAITAGLRPDRCTLPVRLPVARSGTPQFAGQPCRAYGAGGTLIPRGL